MALDAKVRVADARKERWKTYDAKRKNLVEELEERERAFKKAKLDKAAEDKKRREENERVKEAGKSLREERAREQLEKNKAMEQQEEENAPPELDPLDTTVRVKWTLKARPDLVSAASVLAVLKRFGPADEDAIVVSLRKGKSKSKKDKDDQEEAKPKFGTALVPFKQIADAFGAVGASGRADMGLEGVEVGWVSGKEPAILDWLRNMGKLGSTPSAPSVNNPISPSSAWPGEKAELPQNQPTTGGDSKFSSFPSTFVSPKHTCARIFMLTIFPFQPEVFSEAQPTAVPASSGLDYESITLMRMRQAERERIEREILEQEAAES